MRTILGPNMAPEGARRPKRNKEIWNLSEKNIVRYRNTSQLNGTHDEKNINGNDRKNNQLDSKMAKKQKQFKKNMDGWNRKKHRSSEDNGMENEMQG